MTAVAAAAARADTAAAEAGAARGGLGAIVVCGCLIALVTFGARAALGLFNQPMTAANGWGREVFGLGFALLNVMWGLGQPFAGAIADRHGVFRVLAGGSIASALGLALIALGSSPGLLYLAMGGLMGLGGAAASFAIVMGAVARLAGEARRSWAFGIVTAASSLGMFVYAALGQALLALLDWRTALLVVAGSVLLVIPLALPFLGDRGGARAGGQTVGQALREAGGHRSYRLLVLGFFVCGYHVAFIQAHLPAFAVDQGLEPWVGAAAISLVGLLNIVGSYGAGVLGGRVSKRKLLCAIYLGRSLVIATYLLLPITAASTLAFAAAMGVLWLSTVPPTSGLVALMFGPRYMTTLFGVVFLSHQLGAFLGAYLGGALYDAFGTYDFVWWTSVALGVAAALVHWPIVERPLARPAAGPAALAPA